MMQIGEYYSCTLGEYPVLSREEEQHLCALVSEGDSEAREKLIKHNLRLVVKYAVRYSYGNRDLLDNLIQEGTLGLTKAVDRFNPEKGTRLSTYAYYWIRKYIFEYFRFNASARPAQPSPEVKKELEELLPVLSRREKEIITLLYGLKGVNKRKASDAARMLGITKGRVSQIRKNALEKIISRKGEKFYEKLENLNL